MKRFFFPVLAALFLVAVAGAACTGSETSTTGAGEDVSESSTPGAYDALLAVVPDTPEARSSVYINDYARVRRMFNSVPLPGPGDGEDKVAQFNAWLPPTAGMPGEDFQLMSFGTISFFGPLNHRNISIQHFAFDARNLDQSIVAGPRSELDIVRGRFNPEAADDALAACSDCLPPDRMEHGGVTYYGWGEDNAPGNDGLKYAPPAFDRAGRGGRVAVLDEYVFRTRATGTMNSLIDAHRKESPSLLGVEEFRLLAGGMSQLAAYTMYLSDNVGWSAIDEYAKLVLGESANQEQLDERKAELANPGLLRPYQALAVGAGKDGDGAFMALALVHPEAGFAEDNAALLRGRIEKGSPTFIDAPWSDMIDVDTLEIYAEGRLLLAKLRGDLAVNPFAWIYDRDNLTLQE